MLTMVEKMTYNKTPKIQKLIVRQNLFSKAHQDYLQKFILGCHWECTIQDPETLLEETVYGTSHFPYPKSVDEYTYIDFENLTKSQILEWLELDETFNYKCSEAEEALTSRIFAYKKNPIIEESPIVSFDSIPD